MKPEGTVSICEGKIILVSDPHVRTVVRRLFQSTVGRGGTISIDLSDANCETVEWINTRFPHEFKGDALSIIEGRAEAKRARSIKARQIVERGPTREIKTKLPLRDYQKTAVELLLEAKSLLVGDDVGLGKTAVAFGAVAEGQTPAVVVCQTHLQNQWKREAEKFLDGPKVHIVKSRKKYDLPDHEILIVPYSKLGAWGPELNGYKLAVYDEAQELRKRDTAKRDGAVCLSEAVETRLSLTATPVYNYGDEIWSVMDITAPSALGSFDEFVREWTVPWGQGNYRVKDPKALNSYLIRDSLMIRRKREEVGRELPPKTKVVQTVEYDKSRLAQMEDEFLELAKVIVSGSFTDRGKATRELSLKLRQQTGIAKAPAVADVVADLVESGEYPVVFGWHREFYSVLQNQLAKKGIKSCLYTGSETPKQKEEAVESFRKGFVDVFIMSLRSGAGLNGLQERASIAVFGELDWSPQVHHQAEGRLARDGQKNNVTSLFLVADGGSDPVIANLLGLKNEQASGIMGDKIEAEASEVVEQRGKALAEELLKRKSS